MARLWEILAFIGISSDAEAAETRLFVNWILRI
jgi:hypothetical protein